MSLRFYRQDSQAGGGGDGKNLPKPVRLYDSTRCRGEDGSTRPARALHLPGSPCPTLSAALGLVFVWCCAPSPVAPPKPCPALPSATELPQGGHWAHHLQVPAGARLPLPVARVCQGGPCCRPVVYSLGFFSLTSIAYRRVIRVYQYEVGDDLSGRFFSSYFSSSLTVVLPMHSGLPRRLRFLTNPHPRPLGQEGLSSPLLHWPHLLPQVLGAFSLGQGVPVSLACWGRRKPGALPCSSAL